LPTEINFYQQKNKSFLVQQFFKNAAEVKGEEPLSSPAGDETPQKSEIFSRGRCPLDPCQRADTPFGIPIQLHHNPRWELW
jgi:hypothetical protein